METEGTSNLTPVVQGDSVRPVKATNMSPPNVHKQIMEVYRVESMSRQQTAKLCSILKRTERSSRKPQYESKLDHRLGSKFKVSYARYLKRGHTIIADRYCASLTKLHEEIRHKRSGLLTEGVILLYDNTSLSKARSTQESLRKIRRNVCSHTIWLLTTISSLWH
ncbi:hypothetical protein TNCV_4853501 [Trichonephila clavipes]|nr:hypothetical protein TNCV_4853501 [Trichonephila clavipes]